MNDLEREIFAANMKQKTAIIIPAVTTTMGYFLGKGVENLVQNHNEEVQELEDGVQGLILDYRVQEAEVERVVNSFPGLDLWVKGYEKLFGEAQQVVGVSDGTFTKVNPEDISLDFLQAPQLSYPLLGAALGLVYGLYKTTSKIRQFSKEKKLLKWVKKANENH